MAKVRVVMFLPCNRPTCAFEGRDCQGCPLMDEERDKAVLLGTVKLHDVDVKGRLLT